MNYRLAGAMLEGGNGSPFPGSVDCTDAPFGHPALLRYSVSWL